MIKECQFFNRSKLALFLSFVLGCFGGPIAGVGMSLVNQDGIWLGGDLDGAVPVVPLRPLTIDRTREDRYVLSGFQPETAFT